VAVTFGYWGSGNSDPIAEAYKGSILDGMNEFGVIFFRNFAESKEAPLPKDKGLNRYSLRALVLERARSAREAVEILGSLIEKYGHNGSVGVYTAADRHEAWMVETTPRHWVALRIPDNEFHVIANQYSIETHWDLASKDLVDYAVAQGWFSPSEGKPFNFKYVYGTNLDMASNVVREKHAKAMLASKAGSITKEDLMKVLRTHYEGTADFSTPVHENTVRRSICFIGTQAAMVWELKQSLPIEIGGVMWYAMSSPCSSTFVPVYVGSTRAPKEYGAAGLKYDRESAWWAFEMLQRLVDKDREALYPMVRSHWDSLEQGEFQRALQMEREASRLWEAGELDKAKALLSDYSYSCLDAAARDAKALVNQASAHLGLESEDVSSQK
jgi:dipeptidase